MNAPPRNRPPLPPVPVRGHTLLCLQGFRGEGYDPMFTAHMAAIHEKLFRQPSLSVRVIRKPDTFCHSCPNLDGEKGCKLHGPESESRMAEQDRQVMQLLSIENEEVLTWDEIVKRISGRIRASMLDTLCGNCPWLPLGYCKEALDRLSREAGAPSFRPQK